MNANELFEKNAEAFRKDTGIWPLGKDQAAMAGPIDEREVRALAYTYWQKQQRPIIEHPDVQRLIKQLVVLQIANKNLLHACKFAKAQIKRGAQKKALPILRLVIAGKAFPNLPTPEKIKTKCIEPGGIWWELMGKEIDGSKGKCHVWYAEVTQMGKIILVTGDYDTAELVEEAVHVPYPEAKRVDDSFDTGE